jgi:ubiquinone/menaquinone biosynthesis C-methylase UbiE
MDRERPIGRATPPPDLVFPDPSDPSREVAWRDGWFERPTGRARVLAYDVAPSGWTDDLTAIHEAAAGSDHFIDVASRRYAISEVARCVADAGRTVLEVGVSSGFLLHELRERVPNLQLIGADYTLGTLERLAEKLPQIPLVQFDLTRCPLPDSSVDVAVLLNVLEHIDDHLSAARQLFRLLRPGGAAIIEVPAGASLYDVYDKALMHFRRYDMSELIALLQNVGFRVERRSHLGFFLYPAFSIVKRLNRWRYDLESDESARQAASAMIAGTNKASRLLGSVMTIEEALRRRIYLPFGVRCLVTCRRPGRDPNPIAG